MPDDLQARREALAWRIRLSERAVSSEALREFFRWRRATATHDQAWQAIEREAAERASKIR